MGKRDLVGMYLFITIITRVVKGAFDAVSSEEIQSTWFYQILPQKQNIVQSLVVSCLISL